MTDLTDRLDEIQARADAEFVAAASTDVPYLIAQVKFLREENERARYNAYRFADALDFGDGFTEPCATLAELVEPCQKAFFEAQEHQECPVACPLCGETLARTTCSSCHGSGCLPNTELAYKECPECAGIGKVHGGCTGMTYLELAEEVLRLRDVIEDVRAKVAE